MAGITVITGGSRSGKSSYALARAEQESRFRLFVATSPETDSEMSERIKKHRRERAGRGWQTFEEERELVRLIERGLPAEPGVVLVDCITLWINNLLFTAGENELSDQAIRRLCQQLLAAIVRSPHRFFVVTSEVGSGIVPADPLTRLWRDLVGTANQTLAAAADEVVLVSCGLPLFLKQP